MIPTLQGMASPALAQPSHDLRSRAGALPGSNGRIAFQSNRTGVLQVFGMNPNGSSQTQMTRINDRSYDAAWYPDGTGLAFSNCCVSGNNTLELYSMNWNGTGITRLTSNSVKDALPSWSPDGAKIAFATSQGGNLEVDSMNADGTGQSNLTHNAATDTAPAWSPDGTRIAFASNRGGNYDIYVMNADGSGVRRLTTDPAVDTEPNWSPSGKRIAWESFRAGNADILTMNGDGTGKVFVTHTPANDERPSWSPDGTKIAFDSTRSGNPDIWVVNTDGSGAVNLTRNPAVDQRPDWQPVTIPLFKGIDVSHWQGTIDFQAVAGAGYRFVFAKATEDQDYIDPTYGTNRMDANAAGMVVGAYHYARPDNSTDDALKEADHFVDTALPTPGDLKPVIDLEDSGGLGVAPLTAWLWAWLGEVQAKTGVKAIIYTSPNFWQTHMGNTDAFAKGGYSLLWIAHWFVPKPTVPGSNWGGYGWTFWQLDDCLHVPGIGGCVDGDVYNGINLDPTRIP